jgi:hypothetical protein
MICGVKHSYETLRGFIHFVVVLFIRSTTDKPRDVMVRLVLAMLGFSLFARRLSVANHRSISYPWMIASKSAARQKRHLRKVLLRPIRRATTNANSGYRMGFADMVPRLITNQNEMESRWSEIADRVRQDI